MSKKQKAFGEEFYAELAAEIDPSGEGKVSADLVKHIWTSGLELLARKAKQNTATCFVGLGTFKPGFRKGGTRNGIAGKKPDGSVVIGEVTVPDRHFLVFDDGKKITDILNG